jgi:multicomponent Na+:H+ antiporter subunit E
MSDSPTTATPALPLESRMSNRSPIVKDRCAREAIPVAAFQRTIPVDGALRPVARRSDARPMRWRAAGRSGVALAGLWWALNPTDPPSWLIGVPAVMLGMATTALLAPAVRPPVRLRAVVGFAAVFAGQSILGALDVAYRALHPRMPVTPGWREVALDLPEGPARVLFANTVTLLPGTLSADIRGDRLIVHTIADTPSLDADLTALQTRVGRVFGRANLGTSP